MQDLHDAGRGGDPILGNVGLFYILPTVDGFHVLPDVPRHPVEAVDAEAKQDEAKSAELFVSAAPLITTGKCPNCGNQEGHKFKDQIASK